MSKHIYDCDICGSNDAAEISVTGRYTLNGEPIHVCKNCGFVYVRERRSAADIAASWNSEFTDGIYTARIPAITARLVFIAETLDIAVGLKGKKVADIGAGEGVFLNMIKSAPYNADVFGIEPFEGNCQTMNKLGIPNFYGTIESFVAGAKEQRGTFDIVTIMWTLEACQQCRVMMDAAWEMLKPGGRVLVGTGSRILVPFKKPLHYYISKNPVDTHPFRFSYNSLRNLFEISGFSVETSNRFIDHDALCLIGRKVEKNRPFELKKDDWRAVMDFFNRWDVETQTYYRNA